MEFSGRVALVTGAGSGLGEATAKLLASEGATVGVHDLLPERVDAVCAAIKTAGGRAVPLVGDVADEAVMRSAVGTLVKEAGRLDIVVANAGINGVWAPIDDLAPAEFDKTVGVNLRGTYLTLHFSVPHLKQAGGGAVVVMSSINGTRTFTSPGASAYSASKAAQAAMANQLAVELARFKIRVNTVCPGSIRSNLGQNTWRRKSEEARFPVDFPAGTIPLTGKVPAEPEDVAQAVRYLVSDAARHVTGTWHYVDGAQSLLI
jgi:NAD(P)-dependent dehydrogenase (short-subunit alcohol dehydrogenase family)